MFDERQQFLPAPDSTRYMAAAPHSRPATPRIPDANDIDAASIHIGYISTGTERRRIMNTQTISSAYARCRTMMPSMPKKILKVIMVNIITDFDGH